MNCGMEYQWKGSQQASGGKREASAERESRATGVAHVTRALFAVCGRV